MVRSVPLRVSAMPKPARRLSLKSRKPASEAEAYYRVDAPAQFVLKRGRQSVERGHGIIVKLSQHGLVFHAEMRISAGMEIEFEVPWPGCEGLLMLKLTGRAVRNSGSLVTVRLVAHKFEMFASLQPQLVPNTAPVTL